MAHADFFFADERVSIVACDEKGVIRVNEYDPNGTLLELSSTLQC